MELYEFVEIYAETDNMTIHSFLMENLNELYKLINKRIINHEDVDYYNFVNDIMKLDYYPAEIINVVEFINFNDIILFDIIGDYYYS